MAKKVTTKSAIGRRLKRRARLGDFAKSKPKDNEAKWVVSQSEINRGKRA